MTNLSTQYNQIGQAYIKGQAQFFGDQNDQALEYVLKNLPDLNGKNVLDAGCGHGEDILEYERLGAYVYGVDTSQFMVEQAKTRVNLPENIYLSSIEKTPFESGFFDVVASRYVMHYLDNYDQAFQEIARILKPGGRLSFVVPHPFRDLTLQTNKQYGQKEVLEVKLYGGQVTIHYPSHTMQEYFSKAFFKYFTLANLSEVDQSDEYEKDNLNLPGFLGITAIKK